MPIVEVTRGGHASVADLQAEMNEWLRAEQIGGVAVEPIRILQARVRFRATFVSADQAERFRRRFDDAPADNTT